MSHPARHPSTTRLQIVVEKRYSNGLQLSANYTWSKSIDNSSIYDGNVSWLANGPNSGSNVQDPNRAYLERSLSTFDMPEQLKFEYTYDLPIGRGRTFFNKMPRALDFVAGRLENRRRRGPFTTASRCSLPSPTEARPYGLTAPSGPIWWARRSSPAVLNPTGSTIISRIRTSSRRRPHIHWAMHRGRWAACALLSSSTPTCPS